MSRELCYVVLRGRKEMDGIDWNDYAMCGMRHAARDMLNVTAARDGAAGRSRRGGRVVGVVKGVKKGRRADGPLQAPLCRRNRAFG